MLKVSVKVLLSRHIFKTFYYDIVLSLKYLANLRIS